ncbi:Poly-beta-1,6-N-acetyl-D-glucosamine synthase [Streptomyces sp. S4.7]|uniref:dolichyl-phosphate beta-glucosyltransferase n=1 Tax=Streptomyces sp. S4.7 TaxID=2705439 RepID=UPI0013973DE1|nr:dolichyl-phosphate beta-glucosyltransferase [Streptomyces sp. S4.7]QHY97171.1 Poly-beta-1,6-N-acetyl-D-glucosamine synthase [Streptomyces sp. S4.7]
MSGRTETGADPRTGPDPAIPGGDGGGSAVDLTVVVPAYNEERRLRPTLDAICAHLSADPDRWGDWELIVVDDGSTDGTAAVAAAAASDEPRIHVLTSRENRGKGYALRQGVLASYGRRVLVTDADLATPIEELDALDALLTPDDGPYDVGPDEGEPYAYDDAPAAAIGSRALPGSRIDVHQRPLREWLGRLGNRLIRLVAVRGISDTQCGFKLFDGDKARAAFAASRLDGWGIDVEILRHFRRAGWPVAEVPVRWSHQTGSKVRATDYGRVLLELLRLRTRTRPVDLAVGGLFLLASVLHYKGLWTDLDRAYLADSMQDQNQWEWFFAVTADNVVNLRNPLFTTYQGYPDGVNLMANTVMLGLSVPLTPVTLLFGPTVTWALVLTLGLTGTAVAWYWLFVRRVTRVRPAAALGAALAAFAPPMMSHGTAHPNFLVLFMIPVIIDRALRLCSAQERRVVRDGVLLGLFAAYQIFLGEEPLLLAAMGMLIFALSYALARPDVARVAARPLLRGLGVALAVCLPLVAFPLYWQFFGPQSYHSVLHGDNAGNSPLAFLEFSGRALLGDETRADTLAMNRTEQNAFYGWPLTALAFGTVVWLGRSPLVKALLGTVLVSALLSMGQRIRIPFTDVVLPGPWRALAHQPLFESVIESRVAMICAPALGVLIALAVARITDLEPRAHRVVGLVAVVAALLPIMPTPQPVRERAEVPRFITDGMYRDFVAEGESVVPVPLPSPAEADALHWQSSTGFGFSVPGGYFNGPWGPDRMGIYGASPRYTSNLLRDVRYGGRIPDIGTSWREQAKLDLAFWKAGVVVLAPQDNDEALYEVVSKLLGRPGERMGGAWVWDIPRAR